MMGYWGLQFRGLYDKIIASGGLIVSEYKPNEKVMPYYFPARNRIIAGLSKGILITEATEKSGSMHTKEYALENNRDLYIIPGRITDIYSKGCNAVIKNCQGVMCLSPEEIIHAYGKEIVGNKETTFVQANMDEQIILDIYKYCNNSKKNLADFSFAWHSGVDADDKHSC